MAIIGKIREKSILLVIIIGLALLAFILTDYKSMFGVNEGEYGIGHVFGEKVDQVRFNSLEAKYGENTWNYYVDSLIMNKEYDALGLSISDKEFNAYLMADQGFGVIKDQSIQGLFVDSITGKVTEESKKLGRIKLKQQLDQAKKNKKDWAGVKSYYSNIRKREKYLDIISQGIYTTTIEAEDEYKNTEDKKSIRYIFKPTNSIEDSEIKYKESDLVRYYADHKYDAKYQNEKGYKVVRYFNVSNAPSSTDSLEFFNEFNVMSQELSVAENDTVYSNLKSDLKQSFFNARSTAVPENHFKAEELFTYPPALDTIFQSADIGQIVGPYACGDKMKSKTKGLNYYAISKVIGKTPTRIKARQILVTISASDDTLTKKNQAESYLNQLSSSADRDITFNALKSNSADPVGEYDNLTELFLNYPEQNRTSFYGEEISSFCTNSAVGSVKLIETDRGFHIVEILERDNYYLPKVASIYKEFKPSEETMSLKEKESSTVLSALYRKISKLNSQEKIQAYFDTTLIQGGYQPKAVQLFDNSPEIPLNVLSEPAANKLIQAAYKSGAKVGTLVGRPVRDKNTYVIGMVYSNRQKGAPSYEEIKKDIKKDFLTAKKNEIIVKNFAGKSLEELAGSESVKPAEVSFKNMNSIDAEVIGSLFSSNGPKENETTNPIKGATGVYVITVDKVVSAATIKSFKVKKEEVNRTSIMQLVRNPMTYNQNRKPSEENYIINGLYERANIIDNRKLLNLGIRN
ncbi:SurA N-terminal domain-containing protein [Crocinitomicaceae bacterium]|nr:SurA N-terminal domain-containing protein [Crocinitomicaceae bacterium]